MNRGKIKRYRWCLWHLVLTSALLGAFWVFVINLPFLLTGLVSSKAWRRAGRNNLFIMSVLRKTQPWWRGDIGVSLPEEVKEGLTGCLCVSNHRSHLDVFTLLQQIPGVRVLTKHLIFLIPGLGAAAVLFRMILVRRGSEKSFWKAMQKVELALLAKNIVHVFPEMTRLEWGETKLQRFTLAPFQKALATNVPVVPIVIWGTDNLWPRGLYKIGLKSPLVIKSLPLVDPQKFSSARKLCDYVRKQIQDEIVSLSVTYPYQGQV